jgi:hypothetical protein
MTPYTVWLVIFGIVAYFIVTDNSIARAFDMLIHLARVQYEKVKWWTLHNPANPLIKYLMWRRANRLAKELMDEFESKSK